MPKNPPSDKEADSLEEFFYPTLGKTVKAASKKEADEMVANLTSDKPSE